MSALLLRMQRNHPAKQEAGQAYDGDAAVESCRSFDTCRTSSRDFGAIFRGRSAFVRFHWIGRLVCAVR